MVILDWAITALLFVVLMFAGVVAIFGYVLENLFEFLRFTFNKIRVIIKS